jgi:4-methyl-5(b-hydroxyethyl)-thiazole monophosphate biosynthesis
VLPGGLGGVASIMGSESAMNAVRFAWENNKFLGAICAGPTILASLGITDGKKATCYPGCETQMGDATILTQATVTDGKIITGTSAGCATAFGLALIAALKGEDEMQRIQNQIVIR